MEAAAGIGLAVVGLAGQLFSASLEGYKLLSAAQSFGRDYEDLSYRIEAEKLYLEKWAEAWVNGQNRRQIDPSRRDYRFAVTTLARIAALFAEVLEHNSRYGIDYDHSPRKRDMVRQLVSAPLQRLSSTTRGSQPTPSGLDQNSVELLASPRLLQLDQVMPDLKDEMNRLEECAKTLQRSLPTKKKVRWSVVDKPKFEGLLARLTEYNEILYKIFPIDSNSHNMRVETQVIQPIATSFEVPPQLPFSRNPLFCGRSEIIDTIHSTLTERSEFVGEVRPLTRKVVVLHGLGGMGKSSIALEYSFQYLSSYTTVLWADATTETSLSRSARGMVEHIVAAYRKTGAPYEDIASFMGLRGLLDANGVPSSDEAHEPRVTGAIKEWLAAQHNVRWLLIIDNYDDTDVNIHRIIPTCDSGHVIITSRRSSLQALGRTVSIDEIDENSGIMLFLKNANKAEGAVGDSEWYDMARQVARKLGFLPLALAQAGSYVSQSQISLQKYLNLFNDNFKVVATRGAQQQQWQSADERKSRTIFTTWEISFCSLSHPAQELLLLCAFLANEDIPDEIFIKQGCKPFDWMEEGSDWLIDALEQIFTLSLAKRKASDDSFWIHPVVHVWARERLDSHAKQTKIGEAVILCGQLYQDTTEKLSSQWVFERRIWSHILSVQSYFVALPIAQYGVCDREVLLDAATDLGLLFNDHGYYNQSMAILESSLATHEHFQGSDHSSTLRTIVGLAEAFRMNSEYGKALEYYHRALGSYEKTLGKDHLSTLTTVHNMAVIFKQQGENDKALEWYRRALDGYEKTLGKDHPS
ncbi:hypothetical protein K440DRAFT_633246, partial [Wilcoxina mikolae CBS 423.85]